MSCRGLRWRTCTGPACSRARRRGGSRSWGRSEVVATHRPLPALPRLRGGGRPAPQPLSQPSRRGGGSQVLVRSPAIPRSGSSAPAAGVAPWTTPFRPISPASRAVGTEVLDRQDRPLALLPAPGGVWRFRAGTEPTPAHQPAHRRRGPALLVPSRRRSARAGRAPPRSSPAPATSSPAARRWRCRPPGCSSRARARSAPS